MVLTGIYAEGYPALFRMQYPHSVWSVPLYNLHPYYNWNNPVGEEPGWTLADLKAAMEDMPEGAQVLSEMTRGSMLNYGIQLSGSQFINWKTGECHFNFPSSSS